MTWVIKTIDGKQQYVWEAATSESVASIPSDKYGEVDMPLSIYTLQQYNHATPSAPSESLVRAVEAVQTIDATNGFATTASPLLDELMQYFNQYEIPIAMLEKLLALKDYRLEFILDDSGSMGGTTDVLYKNLMHPMLQVRFGGENQNQKMQRWEEMQDRLYVMMDLLSYIPTGKITMRFLNRSNVIELDRTGKTFEQFKQEAHTKMAEAFTQPPGYGTPKIGFHLSNIFKSVPTLGKVITYLITDGVPSDVTVESIANLIKNRNHPENCPVTLMSCTDRTEEVEWLKKVDEDAPFVAEIDDYQQEKEEIKMGQGLGLNYNRGFWIISQLVAAINPHDLDALDEPLPLTKYTLESLLGYKLTREEYRMIYWNHFPHKDIYPDIFDRFSSDAQQVAREIVSEADQTYRASAIGRNINKAKSFAYSITSSLPLSLFKTATPNKQPVNQQQLIEPKQLSIEDQKLPANPEQPLTTHDSNHTLQNMPAAPYTTRIDGSRNFKVLNEYTCLVNAAEAKTLINAYELAKKTTQSNLKENQTIDERLLKDNSIQNLRYPVLDYHLCYESSLTLKGMDNIHKKIGKLTQLQHAYYRFLLILSEVKTSTHITNDFDQAFPELQTANQLSLEQIEQYEQIYTGKLSLIEKRLYIAMQARYLKEINVSVNETAVTDEKGIVNAHDPNLGHTHKLAQSSHILRYTPLNDETLDSVLNDNNLAIDQLYGGDNSKLKKQISETSQKKSIMNDLRKERANLGLTCVFMLHENDTFFPIDQNTICMQIVDGRITAYWSKGFWKEGSKIQSTSFDQTGIPYTMHRLLPSAGCRSYNKELINEITSKFLFVLPESPKKQLTRFSSMFSSSKAAEPVFIKYGNSHPKNNPNLFVTLPNEHGIDSLPIPSNVPSQKPKPTGTNYQEAILGLRVKLNDVPKGDALKKIKTYCHDIRDFLRKAKDSLMFKDKEDGNTFTEIWMLFKMLTTYFTALNNPEKAQQDNINEACVLSHITEQLEKLGSVVIDNDAMSSVALAALDEFVNIFNNQMTYNNNLSAEIESKLNRLLTLLRTSHVLCLIPKENVDQTVFEQRLR